ELSGLILTDRRSLGVFHDLAWTPHSWRLGWLLSLCSLSRSSIRDGGRLRCIGIDYGRGSRDRVHLHLAGRPDYLLSANLNMLDADYLFVHEAHKLHVAGRLAIDPFLIIDVIVGFANAFGRAAQCVHHHLF